MKRLGMGLLCGMGLMGTIASYGADVVVQRFINFIDIDDPQMRTDALIEWLKDDAAKNRPLGLNDDIIKRVTLPLTYEQKVKVALERKWFGDKLGELEIARAIAEGEAEAAGAAVAPAVPEVFRIGPYYLTKDEMVALANIKSSPNKPQSLAQFYDNFFDNHFDFNPFALAWFATITPYVYSTFFAQKMPAGFVDAVIKEMTKLGWKFRKDDLGLKLEKYLSSDL